MAKKSVQASFGTPRLKLSGVAAGSSKSILIQMQSPSTFTWAPFCTPTSRRLSGASIGGFRGFTSAFVRVMPDHSLQRNGRRLPSSADAEHEMAAAVALEIPRVDLIESYRGLVREFKEAGEDLIPFSLSFPHEDGAALVERLAREARGEGLPEGFVAHSTYWLVLEGTTVVGVSNLRHELTPFLRHEGGHIGYGVRPSARDKGFGNEILRQTLARAAELGLERVLVACDADNERSIRTIVRNGGVLEADHVIAHDGAIMQRYWITLGREAV